MTSEACFLAGVLAMRVYFEFGDDYRAYILRTGRLLPK